LFSYSDNKPSLVIFLIKAVPSNNLLGSFSSKVNNSLAAFLILANVTCTLHTSLLFFKPYFPIVFNLGFLFFIKIAILKLFFFILKNTHYLDVPFQRVFLGFKKYVILLSKFKFLYFSEVKDCIKITILIAFSHIFVWFFFIIFCNLIKKSLYNILILISLFIIVFLYKQLNCYF